MREFAPARVCLTPALRMTFVGDWSFVGSHFVGSGFVRLGFVRLGFVRLGFVESVRFVEARVCRKGVIVGVQGYSGGRFLRGAVSRGGGFSRRGFLAAGGFLGWGFSVDRFGRGRRWPALVVLRRLVTRGRGLWMSGVSGRTGGQPRLGLSGTGFVGDWVCRGPGLSGTGFVGDWVCRGLGLAGDWDLPRTGTCRSGS